MDDLVGKLVRWENGEQWFTAEVTGTGTLRGSWRGTVVDPGNYVGASATHPYFMHEPLTVGEHLPNLVSDMITVVEKGTTDGNQ